KTQSDGCVQDRYDPLTQTRGEPVRRQFDCSELLAPIREILHQPGNSRLHERFGPARVRQEAQAPTIRELRQNHPRLKIEKGIMKRCAASGLPDLIPVRPALLKQASPSPADRVEEDVLLPQERR